MLLFLIPPQTDNAHRESDHRQPGPSALHAALAVHLALDTLSIDILFGLHDDKILIPGSTGLGQAETGAVLNRGQGPVLQTQVAVEPEIQAVGGKRRDEANPDEIGVLSSRRRDAEGKEEAGVHDAG